MENILKPEQQETLVQFYAAATQQDEQTLRSLLTDDFTFRGPIGDFDNPNDYASHLASFVGTISDSRYVAEGNRVVHMSILHAEFPTGPVAIPLCDVFTFEGRLIADQELFTDASLFPRA